MKQYFIGDKEITEAEAKEIEAKNRKVLRNGTIEELLKIQFVIVKEDFYAITSEKQSRKKMQKVVK